VPFDALFRREAASAEAVHASALDSIHQDILETYEQLEVYDTPAWEKVEAILSAEAQDAFRALMNAEGEQILLARERARVIAKLRSKPEELRARLAQLQRDRAELEGETDA
jgi:hypothetical protein